MMHPLTKNNDDSSFSNLGYKSNDILMNFKLKYIFGYVAQNNKYTSKRSWQAFEDG